jgi:uncharacterized repeat protein (TIGR04138 family)
MDTIRQIATQDGRYDFQAFQFLYEALEVSVKSAGRDGEQGAARHVSGQELLQGIREYGLKLFGPLAARVFRSWGVEDTLDWGNMVFLLVENNLLNRQDEDTLDDFKEGYDFEHAFVDGYEVELSPEVVRRISSSAE